MENKIREKIETAKKIAIFCHENADGDAVGSVLGLGKLLENMGKNIKFVVPGGASKVFSFMKGYEKLQPNFEFDDEDLLIMVDCCEYSRLGNLIKGKEEYFNSHDVVVIDHHEERPHPGHWLIIRDTIAASCCEVIFENTKDIWQKYYTPEIATSLYLGLTTDSGNFCYDEDHEKILNNALGMIKLGANKKLIIDNVINSKSTGTITFLKKILERLKIDGDIAYAYYDIDELKEYGIDNEEASYSMSIIQKIKGPQVVIIIRKEGEKVKSSLRSKETDVSEISKTFGGGGHIHAAGFTTELKGDFKNTIKEIIEKIKTLI